MSTIHVWTDGACNNSGTGPEGKRMGLGIVIRQGTTQYLMAATHGDGTSNKAEWAAMIAALKLVRELVGAMELTPASVQVHTDSRLLVKTLGGEWLASHGDTYWSWRRSKLAIHRLEDDGCPVTVKWVPREENEEADKLSRIGRLRTPVVTPYEYKNMDDVDAELRDITLERKARKKNG